MSSRTDLPRALPTIWRSLRRAYRAEPGLAVASIGVAVAAMTPDALFALWLKLLADGVTQGRQNLLYIALLGLAGSVAAGWLLQIAGGRMLRRFRFSVAVAFETHVADLQASTPTLEHHERPDYLNRLTVLREAVFQLSNLYETLSTMVGALLRLTITVGLLASVHPALAALVIFAVPPVAVTSWGTGMWRRAEERAAPHLRLSRHLFDLGTTAAPGKDVRLNPLHPGLVQRRRRAWQGWYDAYAAVRYRSAWRQAGAWALFGAAYAGAIALAATVLDASPGDLLLVLAAGSRLSQYVGMTVDQTTFLRMWVDASRILGWLEDHAHAHRDTADHPAPAWLASGIYLENVSFHYPGTDTWVLQNVSLHLPAGSVVAIVGDNGAGKTTLVKLLSRFYEPTAGRITADGTDLSRINVEAWRSRLAGAYQDFYRFELPARHAIGIGDLDRLDDLNAIRDAVTRAGADDVVARLPHGLDTQLGTTWTDGAELSFGQWQKIALARGFMRNQPLLLILDEPTAALDAETEHALFESFAAGSRAQGGASRITILISHRFSTVRMADLIIVLDSSQVVEVGSHDELLSRGGTYAELYTIQASAYR